MRLTLIHPCIGRRAGQRYIRGWQMEPLAPALLASLTPSDVEIQFYDDRMEPIPFDEQTDLVAISVETYTAKRSYQIASEYRRRNVPVVMGGFHSTLVPEEVTEYAEAVVVGEAEDHWQQLIEDFRNGTLKRIYRHTDRPALRGLTVDRSIFKGKKYLPLGLVEAGRGCHLRCEFCSIQSFFKNSQNRRPIAEIVAEVNGANRKAIFFVDDNFSSNIEEAKDLMRQLAPLKVKWVSQASIHAGHDEEFLRLARESGCQMLLIGLETLNPETLKRMRKGFNLMKGGFEVALSNFHRYGIRLYVTFMQGYDGDSIDSFKENVEFAKRHKFFMVSFNHVTPFPGTPLYDQLQLEGRLLYDQWWLDPDYRYGMLPFIPLDMSPEEARQSCLQARRDFYSLRSIFLRFIDFRVNSRGMIGRRFLPINLLLRREIDQREHYPLGDETYSKPLVKVDRSLTMFEVSGAALASSGRNQDSPLRLRRSSP